MHSISEIKNNLEQYEFLSLEMHGILLVEFECLSDNYHHSAYAEVADSTDHSQRLRLHLTVSQIITGMRLENQISRKGKFVKFEHPVELTTRVMQHPKVETEYILVVQQIRATLPIPDQLGYPILAKQYMYEMTLDKYSQHINSRSIYKVADVFIDIKKDIELPIGLLLEANVTLSDLVGHWIYIEGILEFAYVDYGEGTYSLAAIQVNHDNPKYPQRIALAAEFFEDFDEFCIQRMSHRPNEVNQKYHILGKLDLIQNNISVEEHEYIAPPDLKYMLKDICHIVMHEHKHFLDSALRYCADKMSS